MIYCRASELEGVNFRVSEPVSDSQTQSSGRALSQQVRGPGADIQHHHTAEVQVPQELKQWTISQSAFLIMSPILQFPNVPDVQKTQVISIFEVLRSRLT